MRAIQSRTMSDKTQSYLERASRTIPWGTQTFAKRQDRDGILHRPAFIQRAKGCRMWDLDGREYIDYRAALGPILLGYGCERVDAAVRKQMESGVLFSMASPIEAEAAEAVLGILGWPDLIRFMKTGADATSCCLRLARSHTRRDHLLTVGYHGYQDWYALEWPNPGIPEVLRDYVHEVPYGDIAAADRVFDTYGKELAAAVVVPLEWHLEPSGDFLAHLRKRCTEVGCALVFDEILTGFRMAPGGAAAYFGVEPDMAAYAKAMANGYPVSAYAGKREWMETLNQTIITTTYAGETLSLAAALEVMSIIRDQPVHEHIFRLGARMRSGIREVLAEAGVPARVVGVDPGVVIDWSPLGEAGGALHQRFFNALYDRGIFANEQWFITYAHREADIDQTLESMRDALAAVL